MPVQPSLRGYAEPLTAAMVEFYSLNQAKFTPDQHPHYIYSPRELSKWTRAIYEGIQPLDSVSVDELVRLWLHEVRVGMLDVESCVAALTAVVRMILVVLVAAVAVIDVLLRFFAAVESGAIVSAVIPVYWRGWLLIGSRCCLRLLPCCCGCVCVSMSVDL